MAGPDRRNGVGDAARGRKPEFGRASLAAAAVAMVALLAVAGAAGGEIAAEAEDEPLTEPVANHVRAPAQSTEVSISVEPREILLVDEKNERFVIDVLLEASWTDNRLEPCKSPDESAVVHQGESARQQLGTAVWWPGFDVARGRGPRETRAISLTLDCDNRVHYSERFVATVSEDFDQLHSFPFDQHSLTLTIVPFASAAAEHTNFVLRPKEENARRFVDGWESAEWTFRIEQQEVRTAAALVTTIEIERKSNWYLANVVLPLVGIVALSWTVFWIGAEKLGERTAISTTSLLTVVAYDFLTSGDLPKLPFTTRLDAFYNASYVAVLLTVAVNILVASRPAESTGWRHELDRVSRVVFPVGYLTMVGLALLGVFSWGDDPGDPGSETDSRIDFAVEAETPGAAVADADFEMAFGFPFEELGDRVNAELSSDFELEAGISEPSQVDVYLLCPADDADISIEMNAIRGELDPWLVLTDQDGQLVVADDDGGSGLDSLIRLEPRPGTCYYLFAQDLTGQRTGRYRLRQTDEFVVRFGLSFDELVEGAQELVYEPEFEREATIGQGDEVDVYRFCIDEDDAAISIAMTAAGGERLDPWLVLYDDEGRFVAEDDDGGGGLNSLIHLPGPTTGCYHLLALDLTREGTGAYLLHEPDDLLAELAQLDELDLGFADIVGGAVDIALRSGLELEGSIDWPGEVDVFRFCPTEDDGILSIAMMAVDQTLDPWLAMYDEFGSLVAANNDDGDSVDSLVEVPASGRDCYYLLAQDLRGLDIGRYRLRALG